MTRQDIERDVARGVAFLDARYPGWFHDINVNRLRMHSLNSCVCGQLAEKHIPVDPGSPSLQNFIRFVKRWGLMNSGTQDLGFNAHVMEGYSVLDEEWRRVILERLASAPREQPSWPPAWFLGTEVTA